MICRNLERRLPSFNRAALGAPNNVTRRARRDGAGAVADRASAASSPVAAARRLVRSAARCAPGDGAAATPGRRASSAASAPAARDAAAASAASTRRASWRAAFSTAGVRRSRRVDAERALCSCRAARRDRDVLDPDRERLLQPLAAPPAVGPAHGRATATRRRCRRSWPRRAAASSRLMSRSSSSNRRNPDLPRGGGARGVLRPLRISCRPDAVLAGALHF